MQKFATTEDFSECVRLHRQYGTTYYFASRQLPQAIRSRVDAIYGFVRVPDEWVDNPGSMSGADILDTLNRYRQELFAGTYGIRPTHAVLRAFLDVVNETEIPLEEATRFLDAMQQDLEKNRYQTYDELRAYMRGSAGAVGVMLVHALEADRRDFMIESAIALGEAMQLTNFIRDVGEDLDRGRIYFPLSELEQFGVSEEEFLSRSVTPGVRRLIEMQVSRARKRFADADGGIGELPKAVSFGVALARELYAKILEKVEQNDYDVFRIRAKTTPQEKMIAAWKLWSSHGS